MNDPTKDFMYLRPHGANKRIDRLGNVTVYVTVAMREEDFEALADLAEKWPVKARYETVAMQVRRAVWKWLELHAAT